DGLAGGPVVGRERRTDALERAREVLRVAGGGPGFYVRRVRVLQRLDHAVDRPADQRLVVDVVQVAALQGAVGLYERPAGGRVQELAGEVARHLRVDGHGGDYQRH